MKKLLLLLIAALTVWHLYSRVESRKLAPAVDRVTGGNVKLYAPEPNQRDGALSPGRYRCDGRQHCSQMSSCEEATYFLQNCPDVKMDGDRDGIPCERQWCG